MPHQCVHCGAVYPDAAKELLEGCSCGSHFFYYIKQERIEEIENKIVELKLNTADKVKIEKDIRDITGLEEKPEAPVILDLESVRVLKPGQFEIDIVNLFSKKRPLIYKLEEGKYIIDLPSTFGMSQDEMEKKFQDNEKDI